MGKLAFIALIVLGPALKQDPAAAQDPAELIEGLRSDDIAVRERAYAGLEKLGEAAEHQLMRATRDSDPDTARSAGRLLRILEFDRKFSPALKKAVPGIARRLGLLGDDAGMRVYLEIADAPPDASGRSPFPDLRRSDLEPLAEMAVRCAATKDEKVAACAAAGRWFHRSAEPAVRMLLHDPEEKVREEAVSALTYFRGRGVIPILLTEYPDTSHELLEALILCESFRPAEAVPRLVPFIHKAQSDIREGALRLLLKVEAHEALPEVLKILKGSDSGVKVDALDFIRSLGARECAGAVLPLLSNQDANVRCAALRCLTDLDAPLPDGAWRKLLDDSDKCIRNLAVARAASRVGAGFIPALRKNLTHPHDDVKMAAIRTLQSLNDPLLLDSLASFLRDHRCEFKDTVMNAMIEIDPVKAVAPIAAVLENSQEPGSARSAALNALKILKALPAPDRLLILTRDRNPRLAVETAWLLAQAAPDVLRPEMGRLLSDEEACRDSRMGDVLERMKSPDLVPLLMKAFTEFEDARRSVAAALVGPTGNAAIPALRALLQDEDEALRREATRVLGDLHAAEARADFMTLLDDPDERVRYAALKSLSMIGFGTDLAPIRALAHDPKEGIRVAAVSLLRGHWVKESIPELLSILDDPESRVAREAAETLVEMGSRELIPKLLSWLDSANFERISLAGDLLAVLRPPEAAPRILAMLEDRDSYIRSWGVTLVGTTGMKDRARRLIPHLGEYRIGDDAVLAIVSLQAREVIPDLVGLLHSPDVVTRGSALAALMGLGAVDAVPGIRGLLGDPDGELRGQAAEALGQFRDHRAVPRLVDLLKSPDPFLRRRVVDALRGIGDPTAAPALVPLLKDGVYGVRCAVLHALGELRSAEAVPDLLRMLRDPGRQAPAPIIEALGRIGSREAGPDLIGWLQDERYWSDTAPALARLRIPEALPALRALLTRKEAADSEIIAEALADLGDSTVLESQFKKGSEAAARILCERGDSRGVPGFLKHLDSSWRVRPDLLNAVRNPAGWKALKEVRVRGRIETSRTTLLELLAGAAGLQVRVETGTTYDECAWPSRFGNFGYRTGSATLVEALTDVLSRDRGWEPGWDFILEKDHLRVLPRARALEFWKQWWADEQAKKK